MRSLIFSVKRYILTPYGVEYRYPGDYPETTVEDAAKALDTARHVSEEIRFRLPNHVLP